LRLMQASATFTPQAKGSALREDYVFRVSEALRSSTRGSA